MENIIGRSQMKEINNLLKSGWYAAAGATHSLRSIKFKPSSPYVQSHPVLTALRKEIRRRELLMGRKLGHREKARARIQVINHLTLEKRINIPCTSDFYIELNKIAPLVHYVTRPEFQFRSTITIAVKDSSRYSREDLPALTAYAESLAETGDNATGALTQLVSLKDNDGIDLHVPNAYFDGDDVNSCTGHHVWPRHYIARYPLIDDE